ncbi:protein IQ-domain 14-like [Trifolium pratense]|uniref:Protein IQ-domain 14-like n=1 Tax=Trifolium pratense TaxID=57577 RepID=A0A2K3LQW2_TRIPR|nr:protein IQ-domain 14-like [Trifolium pratense]
MAKKKKSWFNLVKRLFIWDTHSTQEKKEKRRKWIFGKLKTKKLPSITAPPTTLKETKPNEAEKEKTKNSEAAVTATEVVILSDVSKDNTAESETFKTVNGVSQSIYQCQKVIQEFAAIKIQTAFRGYLVSLSKLFS